MSGRLKKGGLDRSTVAVERALQGIGALESSLASNAGFNASILEMDCTPGSPLETEEDSNTYTETVPFAATGATIVACTQLDRVVSWSISNGVITVVTGLPEGAVITFSVF